MTPKAHESVYFILNFNTYNGFAIQKKRTFQFKIQCILKRHQYQGFITIKKRPGQERCFLVDSSTSPFHVTMVVFTAMELTELVVSFCCQQSTEEAGCSYHDKHCWGKYDLSHSRSIWYFDPWLMLFAKWFTWRFSLVIPDLEWRGSGAVTDASFIYLFDFTELSQTLKFCNRKW